MHFPTPSLLALAAVFASHTTAFVIDTYSDTACSTSVQRSVNIWDNTCATWPKGFKSFKITTWGGKHQYGYFFSPGNCGSLPDAIRGGYVDSGSNAFKLETCYDFDDASANAIASYRG
ncbi:hypothetical protein SVAN01_07562 [Stagonosporopsis vannaccii]|nr:hypothetical protein SVAN01_07562 [Stagonosporopsis vannaccii]